MRTCFVYLPRLCPVVKDPEGAVVRACELPELGELMFEMGPSSRLPGEMFP